MLLPPPRIAQEVQGRADAGAGDPLAVVLTQLFALAGRLRERGYGAPPDRGARPPGLSRMATLADALYILRTSRQVRQSQIAESLEVHPSVVSGWEHGKGRPSLERFGQIADRLRLDLGELDDALERTVRIGYHRRRPRRTLPDVDLEPVRIAAHLLGRRPGDRTDPAQAELQRLLEALFIKSKNADE